MYNCTWTERTPNDWEAGCEFGTIYMEDTPNENGYKYCPGCGKQIEEFTLADAECISVDWP